MISVVIATAGASEWADLAWARAYPSVLACAERPPLSNVCVQHYADLTVSAARNAAARDVEGDWLCFLDADDELEPGFFAAMYGAFGAGGITTRSLLVPALRRVFPDGREEGPGIPNYGRWPILNECVIGTLIAREQFERLGGFRDFPALEDYDLFLRAADDGAALVYVEDAVYRECVNPEGRNRDQRSYDVIWADHLARVVG